MEFSYEQGKTRSRKARSFFLRQLVHVTGLAVYCFDFSKMPIIRKLANPATSDLEEKADDATTSTTETEKSPENTDTKSTEPAEAKEDFPLPTSIEDEKQQIKSIHDKEQLEEGATWYLINTKWCVW